MNRKRFCL